MEYRLHHVGFVVSEIDQALDAWLSQGYVLYSQKTNEVAVGVNCLTLADPSGNLIELIEPESGSTALSARLARGGGLDHLCYQVSSIADALEAEVRLGGHLVVEPFLSKQFNTLVAFIFRNTSLLVELLEDLSE